MPFCIPSGSKYRPRRDWKLRLKKQYVGFWFIEIINDHFFFPYFLMFSQSLFFIYYPQTQASRVKWLAWCLYIRECGSTLYVGLQHEVPPSITKFKQFLLPTQVGMPYTNIHKHRTSYFKSTPHFLVELSTGSPFLPPDKKRGNSCDFFIIIIIIIFIINFFRRVFWVYWSKCYITR